VHKICNCGEIQNISLAAEKVLNTLTYGFIDLFTPLCEIRHVGEQA